jgi:2-amino-4-hydroxy-6-hydroxymethyldihydropteridine diphosphokinase
MPEIYVGAGSNLDAAAKLRTAAAALGRAFGALRLSGVYRSAAFGAPADDYLNVCMAFSAQVAPAVLKAELVAIEAAAGRVRGARSALVPLDLDLLLYGARVDAENRLPHPDALRHAFVLAPLAELAADVAHPVTGERLASAWARRSPGELVRLGSLESVV